MPKLGHRQLERLKKNDKKEPETLAPQQPNPNTSVGPGQLSF